MSKTPQQERDDYFFDLRGYRVLPGAVSAQDLAEVNRWIDGHPASSADAASFESGETGKWYGNVEVQSYMKEDGVNYQNIIEGGPIFEKMMDHASWITAFVMAAPRPASAAHLFPVMYFVADQLAFPLDATPPGIYRPGP